ncbi:MAG TPA: hypothetical protein VEF06_08465 [Bryobacteraceae bacterium]|nr:hypothetical protein [Bryobacteraceae bacterium]
MLQTKQRTFTTVLAVATFLFGGVAVGPVIAQKATPKAQDRVALGEDEVKQLLLLMDTDKNGKVSRAEFMAFMQKEFERLDKDKSGELDPKELAESQIRSARPPVGK